MKYGWSDDPFDFGLRAVSGYGSLFMYPSIIFTGLLLLVPPVWLAVRWVRMISTGAGLSRRRRIGPEPWCRVCGYSAFAAAGPRCSECGTWRSPSNLVRSRDLGPWRLERALAVGSIVGVWTAAMLALGVPLFEVLLQELQPADRETRSVWTIHSTDQWKPLHLVVGRAEGDDGSRHGSVVLIRRRHCSHDHTPSPRLQYRDGAWSDGSIANAHSTWPDARDIRDWVRRVEPQEGFLRTDAGAVDEACRAAAECVLGRPPGSTKTLGIVCQYERTVRLPTWPTTSMIVAVSMWILLWVFGAAYVLRVRSRRGVAGAGAIGLQLERSKSP